MGDFVSDFDDLFSQKFTKDLEIFNSLFVMFYLLFILIFKKLENTAIKGLSGTEFVRVFSNKFCLVFLETFPKINFIEN